MLDLGHNSLNKSCKKSSKIFFSSLCLIVLWLAVTLSSVDAHPGPWDCAARAVERHQLPEALAWAQIPGAPPPLHPAATLDTAQSRKCDMEGAAFSTPKVTGNVSPPRDGRICKAHTKSRFVGSARDRNLLVLGVICSCWNLRRKFQANWSGLNSASN